MGFIFIVVIYTDVFLGTRKEGRTWKRPMVPLKTRIPKEESDISFPKYCREAPKHVPMTKPTPIRLFLCYFAEPEEGSGEDVQPCSPLTGT